MELNDGLLENGLKFSADGMIHAVQPMAQRESKQRATHHKDSSDDPLVCLTCDRETCEGSARCYRRRKNAMERINK